MNTVPSLKTFRVFLIALLAVALTGGIAAISTPPASATTEPSISLTIFAAEGGLGLPAEGTPIYLRGTGLFPGSQMTLEVSSPQCPSARGSFTQTVPDNGVLTPTVRMPNLTLGGAALLPGEQPIIVQTDLGGVAEFGIDCTVNILLTAQLDGGLFTGCGFDRMPSIPVQLSRDLFATNGAALGALDLGTNDSEIDCTMPYSVGEQIVEIGASGLNNRAPTEEELAQRIALIFGVFDGALRGQAVGPGESADVVVLPACDSSCMP